MPPATPPITGVDELALEGDTQSDAFVTEIEYPAWHPQSFVAGPVDVQLCAHPPLLIAHELNSQFL